MNDILSDYDKAMQVINDLSKEYEKWSAADLERLTQAYDEALYAPSERQCQLIQEDIFRAAHDMKGQGATFSYELITQIGKHLCRYVERKSFFGPAEMEAVSKHIQALAFVIDHRLTGDGGAEGQKLAAQIEGIT